MSVKKILAAVMVLVLVIGSIPAFAYSMPYYIHVDLTNEIVTVYRTSDRSIVRQMLCSSGLNDKTPTGVYYMPAKERDDERTEWYYMPNQYCWVKWATKIYYAYFFHSITFSKQNDNAMVPEAIKAFGNPASHGCVRLRVDDAKFIAKNCLAGTYVKIYKSHEPDEELRQLLYISSYSADEMSYDEFWGVTEDGLGRGSGGAEVLDLQHRMNDLGYYGGAYDSMYGDEMISSMKALQKDMGLKQTGSATSELLDIIYSDEAPVSAGSISISEGNSGPVVRKLQTALQELKLYDGPIDGIYDTEVTESVKTFEDLCGYDVDGVADREVQYAAYYVLNDVRTRLSAEEFDVERVGEEVVYGTVNSPTANITVRSKPSTESDELGVIVHGQKILALAVQGEWAQIVSKNGVGYVKKKYLSNPQKEQHYTLKYTSGSGSYILGNTLQERLSGARTMADTVLQYYTTEGYVDYLNDSDVTYCTVETGADSVQLNLRAEPNTESEVLLAISNGTSLRVLGQENGWVKVGIHELIGYLMEDYLSIWQGTEEDAEDVLATQTDARQAAEEATAKVYCMINRGNVPIYGSPDANTQPLGTLGMDGLVEVVERDDTTGWAKISYHKHIGYVQVQYLTEPIGA